MPSRLAAPKDESTLPLLVPRIYLTQGPLRCQDCGLLASIAPVGLVKFYTSFASLTLFASLFPAGLRGQAARIIRACEAILGIPSLRSDWKNTTSLQVARSAIGAAFRSRGFIAIGTLPGWKKHTRAIVAHGT